MRMFGYTSFWPLFGLGWIIEILFWVFFALIIAKLISFLFSRKHSGELKDEDFEDNEKDENALDILKKRYAKGEITKKEFESMKKDIG